jgi:hypothetical protein
MFVGSLDAPVKRRPSRLESVAEISGGKRDFACFCRRAKQDDLSIRLGDSVMCLHFLRLVAIASIVATFAAGCGNSEKPVDAMTLYSLDGSYFPEEGKVWKGEMFHGFPVLAKTEIESASDRMAILTAVKQGITQYNGSTMACFWPHHGVSLLQNGKRIDYVICFHCLKLEQSVDESVEFKPINRSAETVLNAQLAKAGITVKD